MKKEDLRKMWRKRVKEFKAGDYASINGYCRIKSIKPTTFQYWLYKDKSKEKFTNEDRTQKWLPVEINKNKSEDTSKEIFTVKIGTAAIEVKEGFNKKVFQEIIAVLIASC
jgi:hypothetical protein